MQSCPVNLANSVDLARASRRIIDSLFAAQSLVTANGGEIEAESAPGAEATASITSPGAWTTSRLKSS